MRGVGRRSVVFFLAVCLVVACSTVKETLMGARDKPTIPRAAQTVAVSDVSERGEYLEATLDMEVPMRFYFAANDLCRALVAAGSEVAYRGLGSFGEVSGTAGTCPAQGTASLRAWHDQQLRRTLTGKPRVVARFTRIYEDDSVLMIRGRLPLAAVLGVMADDLVAVLPARSDCRRLAESGEAFMNYERSAGPVFSLTGGETRCEFLGLAQPLRK